jgi:mitogen-activated protein kinase kinase
VVPNSVPPPQPLFPSLRLCLVLRTVVDDSDTQNSRLRFSGKAILHSEGVDFSSGQSFSLRLSDLELQEELGKGNYGTVVHVIHRVTNAHMAMKQIKLELDNSKFMAIITELQVLHEAKTNLIVDFYGGFFAESCVFICMEYVTPLTPSFLFVDGG